MTDHVPMDKIRLLLEKAARLDEVERERDQLRVALTVIRDERGSGYAAWEIANNTLEDLDDG